LRVALEAADLRVAAVERPAGERVIELLHRAAGPADEPRVATDVLDVALLARLAAVLSAVQAAARGELAAEILVAVEAEPGDDLVARLVALRAVVIALDGGVRARQRSRRQHLGRSG